VLVDLSGHEPLVSIDGQRAENVTVFPQRLA
jgi:hypothetical protein